MACVNDDNCPNLYYCQFGMCVHQPITYFSFQLVASCFLVPIFTALCNRIGASTIWLIYPILTTIMAYQLADSFDYIAPIVMAASFIMLYLAVKQKSDNAVGPAINFYTVNVTIPALIVGSNMGLIFAKTIPELYTTIIGIILSLVFIFFGIIQMKDMRADEKISDGFFRKLLPSRLQKSRKFTVSIQMAMIQQADSEYEQHQQQMSPTRKTKIRTQLLSNLQNTFPVNQLIVCLLCFLGFECICISMPQIVAWSGAKGNMKILGISYGILIGLMILGEVYLYVFYIKPIMIQQEMNKVNLGLMMDGAKMIKICIIGFIGGYLQGFIGFGFYFALFLYLLHSQSNLNHAIATCGFINIFLGAIFSLNSIFCTQFHWISYLIVFGITLALGIGTQYLLDYYINNSISPSSLNSKLIILCIVIMVLCLIFLCTSLGLNWSRFGFNTISMIGSVPKC